MCSPGLWSVGITGTGARVKNLDFGGILTEVPSPNVMCKCIANTQDLLSVW